MLKMSKEFDKMSKHYFSLKNFHKPHTRKQKNKRVMIKWLNLTVCLQKEKMNSSQNFEKIKIIWRRFRVPLKSMLQHQQTTRGVVRSWQKEYLSQMTWHSRQLSEHPENNLVSQSFLPVQIENNISQYCQDDKLKKP